MYLMIVLHVKHILNYADFRVYCAFYFSVDFTNGAAFSMRQSKLLFYLGYLRAK